MGKKKDNVSVRSGISAIQKHNDQKHAAYHGKMANEKDMKHAEGACAYGSKGCKMK